jgi:hypothetical protein
MGMVKRMVLNEFAYFGKGSRGQIVEHVKNLELKKVLVVSDSVLVDVGVTKKVTDVLDSAGIPYDIFSEIKQNPTIKNVQDGVAAYKASGADGLIAVGGGSSMDTAKGIGIIATNPECARYKSTIEIYTGMRDTVLAAINECATRYSGAQTTHLKELLAGYRSIYDPVNRRIDGDSDDFLFLDYVSHPNSMVFDTLANFDTFPALCSRLDRALNLDSFEDCSLLHTLLSNATSKIFAPKVKADGPGSANSDLEEFGFELFVNENPLSFLDIITERTDFNDVEGGVEKAVEALKCFTASWKEIVSYVCKFTMAEDLSGKVNSVRHALSLYIE